MLARNEELTASNETRYERKHVDYRLQTERLDDVVDAPDGVLSVIAVDLYIESVRCLCLDVQEQVTYIGTEQHVDKADKSLSADHALPEVHGVTHLSQESDEENGTTVGV